MEQTQPAAGQAPVTTKVTARRFRLASPATAAVLGAVVLLLVATSVPLAGLVHQLTIPVEASAVIPVLVSAAVGVVVARHQPRNPLGWLLILFTLLVMLSIDAGYYAVLCYSLGHYGPLAPVAVLLVPLWAPAGALFALVILLFPDGRLTSRRWRWVLWAYAGLVACYMAVSFARTIAAVTSHAIRLDSAGDVISTQDLPPGLLLSSLSRSA